MTYLKRNLIALDQFGNTLADGEPDCTISARVGYHVVNKRKRYWLILRFLIDNCFYPLEGPNHCKRAYYMDMEEDFHSGSMWARAVLMIGIVTFCIPFTLKFWLINIMIQMMGKKKLHEQVHGNVQFIPLCRNVKVKFSRLFLGTEAQLWAVVRDPDSNVITHVLAVGYNQPFDANLLEVLPEF